MEDFQSEGFAIPPDLPEAEVSSQEDFKTYPVFSFQEDVIDNLYLPAWPIPDGVC